MKHILPEVVEHHDVGIHVEEVVAVGRIVICCPLLRFGALIREHVVTMFGFIIHTVKASHL